MQKALTSGFGQVTAEGESSIIDPNHVSPSFSRGDGWPGEINQSVVGVVAGEDGSGVVRQRPGIEDGVGDVSFLDRPGIHGKERSQEVKPQDGFFFLRDAKGAKFNKNDDVRDDDVAWMSDDDVIDVAGDQDPTRRSKERNFLNLNGPLPRDAVVKAESELSLSWALSQTLTMDESELELGFEEELRLRREMEKGEEEEEEEEEESRRPSFADAWRNCLHCFNLV